MLTVLLAVAILQQQDAYADPGAANLVAQARAQRARNERLVTGYSADVTQRIGVGLRALRRDRMLFGQELAAHIEWHRDGPSQIRVTGARERIPVAMHGDQVPDDLDAHVMWLVLDPSADYLRLAGDDADGFRHPLSEGSESDYRFSSGDTSTITLPNGSTIRLLELVVRPRRADFKLMNGSLWFDANSYGLVRAAFAPARPFDIELDADSGDADDIPAMLKPIRAEVRYVTIEYGLYETRWWMMRYVAVDAEAQASVLKVPVRFERTYEHYRVQGGTEPAPGARRPAGSVRPHDKGSYADSVRNALPPDSLGKLIASCVQRMIDSAQAQRARERERGGVQVRISTGRFDRQCSEQLNPDDRWPVTVSVPDDTASLLRSADLGEPILNMGDVISETELRQLGSEIGAIPQQPWMVRPQLPRGVGSILKDARYNRVEALSLGADAKIDFGRLSLDGLGRIGVADWEPNFELGLTRPGRNAAIRLGGYRRLAAANPDVKPFGIINSFGALLLQRDDGEYFRTLGAELTFANTNAGWWSGRVYYEGQRQAGVHTQASLPHLFSGTHVFRPNIVAQSATEAGGSLTLRGSHVLSRSAVLGADVTVDGATGTFDFGRVSGAVRTTITGIGKLAIGLEGAAGTSTGTVPVQSLFFLGGPPTLRGYTGGSIAGPAFWRGRMEVANQLPVVRLALFSDMGWAGPTAGFTSGRPLWGVGAGVSVLDGIIRMDVTKRLRQPQGWRFDVYLDGIL